MADWRPAPRLLLDVVEAGKRGEELVDAVARDAGKVSNGELLELLEAVEMGSPASVTCVLPM